MQCEEVQLEIAAGTPRTASVQEHLSNCAECRSFEQFDVDVSRESKGWRVEGAPVGLRDRIEQRLTKKRVNWFPVRSGLLAAGFCGLLILAFFLVGSRGTAEAAFRRMVRQIAQVQSAHLTLYWRPGSGEVQNGPMSKAYELWWKAGAWREISPPSQGGDRLKLQTGSGITYMRYDPSQHQVTSAEEVGRQISRFTINDIAATFMDNVTSYTEQALGGDTVAITASDRGDWSRMVFYVDPRTSLPFSGDKEYRDQSGWHILGHFEVQFNQPIDPAIFEPTSLTPKG